MDVMPILRAGFMDDSVRDIYIHIQSVNDKPIISDISYHPDTMDDVGMFMETYKYKKLIMEHAKVNEGRLRIFCKAYIK